MRVLIAEDQVQEAEALAALLHGWGYDPVVVGDGLAALAELKDENAPRLALLDWGLPRLDGVEVCAELRSEPLGPYTYLVLVTGRGGREDRIAALEAGADDFLPKPIDPAELRARLGAGRRIVNLQQQLLEVQARLKEQASRDSLTGLWNRPAILETLERELARGRRDGQPVGVLLADVDNFKQVNDTYGHLVGDEVLHEAAQRMLTTLRPYDSVGRYGGEEFLVVLPGCRHGDVLGLAERLRDEIASSPITAGTARVELTISLGAAWWSAEVGGDVVTLLRAADEALYRAKRCGRNRAELAAHAADVRASETAGTCQPPVGG